MRPISIQPHFLREHGTLISYGETKVLCYASLEERVPPWLLGAGHGWLTAEYSMLPTASYPRQARERDAGGRTGEIQRTIGRALRSSLHLNLLPTITIKVDCDVLIADGGTRTAAITGAYISLASLIYAERHRFSKSPLKSRLAAVSVGIVGGTPMLDLAYDEDSACDVDGNVVRTDTGEIVEMNFTAERSALNDEQMGMLLALANEGLKELFVEQAKHLPERLQLTR